MAPFQPIPDVYYRIQNVDFGTFLELHDVTEKAALIMRPMKDSKKQQWVFVASATSKNFFKIQNAASQSQKRPVYMTVNREKGSVVSAWEQRAEAWMVTEIDDNDEYNLICPDIKTDQDSYIQLSESGQVKLLTDEASLNANNPPEDLRWRIVEVLPSVPKDIVLPKDTYRIRNLNGIAIHIVPNSNMVTVKKQEKGGYEAWDVEPKGNGRCIIQSSVEKSSFLGWQKGKDGLAKLSKASSPHIWELTSLGSGFSYSISIKYLVGKATIILSVSLGDNDEVVLKPSKLAHNQVWLFEPTDASEDTALPVIDKPPPPPYEDVRYSEIPSGNYYLVNCGYSGRYFALFSGPYRFIPYTSSHPYCQFSIKYNSNSAEFEVRATYYEGGVLSLAVSDMALVPSKVPTTWVLSREIDPTASGGYRYYICVAKDHSIVISGDTTRDVNGADVFRLDKKDGGNATQMWKLVKC